MFRNFLAATALSLLLTGAAFAEPVDGTWVCAEMGSGKALGTLVLSGLEYSFTKPDGTSGEDGEIYYQGDDPAFVVTSGALVTELTAIGAILDKDASGPVLYVAVEHGRPVECEPGQ